MTGLTLALVLTLLQTNAEVPDQALQAMPSGVILTGTGDNGSYAPFLAPTQKIKSLRHFEKFDDDLLVSKLSEGAFVFIKKNYPPYKQLRFRKHVLDLFSSVGYNNAFSYQELVTPEFEIYLNTIWRNTPQIVPDPNTKLAFVVTLQSSAIINGEAIHFNFAPRVKISDLTRDALFAMPAKLLTDKSEISERLKSLIAIDKKCQYSFMKDPPVSSSIALVRDALESFKIYYENENSKLNSKVDNLLTAQIWDDTKARRKTKDMRELKDKIPAAFNMILGIRKEELSYGGLVPSTEDTLTLSEAPLSHQYMLEIQVVANGKQFDINLPI